MPVWPEYRWKQAPKHSADGLGHNYGFFATVKVDAKSRGLTVTQYGIDGRVVATQSIDPIV